MNLQNFFNANCSKGYNRRTTRTILVLQKRFERLIILPEDKIKQYFCFLVNFHFQQV